MEHVAELLQHVWGLWLMIFFLGIVAYAYWPKNKGRFNEDAMIPFRDEHEEGQNGGLR